MNARIAVSLLFLAAPVAAQGAPGQISFSETIHGIPGSPAVQIRDIDAADVNGDGHADLVVARTDRVYAYLGAGDGSFGAALENPLPPSVYVYRTDVAELNGDGCADALVVWTHGRVMFSNCDGTFTLGPTLQHPLAADCAVIADVDADGWNDVVLSGWDLGAGHVRVYRGTGGGAFAWAGAAALPAKLWDLSQGDVNGDGLADAIGSGYVFFGQPSGTVCCPYAYTALGPSAGVEVADLVPDGRPDFALSQSVSPTPPVYGPHVYPKSSQGDFADVVISAVPLIGEARGEMLAGDFDADGRLDLAGRTGDFSVGYSIAVVRGNGDGSFAAGYSGGVALKAHAVATADFDEDGLPDLVVTHANNLSMSVLLDTTVPSTWVDLGHALAGSDGKPLLSGTGALAPGASTSLDLLHAAASSPSVLVAGGTQLALPILGGVLVPSPEVLVFGLTTTALGTLSFSFTWPGGIPSGASLYFQAWTADAVAVQGWSASNGLAATVP